MASLISRTSGAAAQECGDELLAWIERAIQARPLDLRPRLQAQVEALGPFVAHARWHSRALRLLEAVSLGDAPHILHWHQNWLYLGPGSQRIAGSPWPVVSSADLDLAVAGALVQGYLNQAMDDDYANLLVRLYGQRPRVPIRPVLPGRTMGPGPAGAFDSWDAAFDPNHAGGRGPRDLLWTDLGRAYRHAPTHPRWAALPETLRQRLSATVAPASP